MVADLVLIALGIALQPFRLSAFILILSTKGGTKKGLGFILGWLACLVLVIAVVVLITGGKPVRFQTIPSTAVLISKLALGIALIVLAAVQWQQRSRARRPPAWLDRLDTMSPWAAAVIAAIMQPWTLVAAAAVTAAQARLSSVGDYLALASFCLLATSSFIAHEYYAYTKHGDNEAAQNGTGYFGYFNGHDQNGTPNAQGQAGDDTGANQGWYSYDMGNWHIISLNIECESAPFNNDCSTTDGGLLAQETQWLAADLASNHEACTIAYWHQPTFTAADTSADVPDPSAPGADSIEGLASDAWWKLLYQAHATLILNGHEHYYARFRPMNPAGQYDPQHGIPQITVGTGGEALDTLATENGHYSNPNVVTAQDEAFGVLKLSLHPDSYSWDYQPALTGPGFDPTTAMSYSDSGTAPCRG